MTPEGKVLSDEILGSNGNVFLALVKDPENVNYDLLNRINDLSLMVSLTDTARFSFYLLTELEQEQLFRFGLTHLSPIEVAGLKGDYISRIAGDGIAFVWINNGIVQKIRKNNNIPELSEFEQFLSKRDEYFDADTFILPSLLNSFRHSREKRFVYLSILSILLFGLFLRAYIENSKRG